MFRTRIAILCALLALALAPSILAQGDPCEENLRNAIDLWNAGDVDGWDAVLTESFTRNSPKGKVTGLAAHKKRAKVDRDGFSEMKVEVDEVIRAGDRSTVLWTYVATTKAGQKIEFQGVSVARHEDCKIAEEWATWDTAKVMLQSGFAINPPDQGGDAN